MKKYINVIINFVACKVEYEFYIATSLTLFENLQLILNIIDYCIAKQYQNELIITNQAKEYLDINLEVATLNLYDGIQLNVY